MDSKKKVFASLAATTIGTLFAGSVMLQTQNAYADHHGATATVAPDKKCSGDKGCGGEKKCSGDKKCGGDHKCSGDKKCSGEDGHGDHGDSDEEAAE